MTVKFYSLVLLLLLPGFAYAASCGSLPVSTYNTYSDIIREQIDASGLRDYVQYPEALVAAVISRESSWNPSAMGDGGNSIGLMQINLPAHPECNSGAITAFDVRENIRCGVSFLAAIATSHDISTPKMYSCKGVQYSGTDAILRYYNGWPDSCSGDPDYVDHVNVYYDSWVACLPSGDTPADTTTDTSTENETYVETLSDYERLAQEAADKCAKPYQIYPCADVTVCASAGGVSYPGYCPLGEYYQCCVPPEAMTGLKYINDEAGILADETEDIVNGFLGAVENDYKAAIFLEIATSVSDPTIQMNEIYEREELNKTTMRVLFLFDAATKQMHVKGRCSYFTNQVWDIVVSDSNKMLLDNDRYDEAFQGIATNIFDYISRDPAVVSCSDVEMTDAARRFVVASMTGHDWMERLYGACSELPQLLETSAAKNGVTIDATSMSEEMCYGMLRKEIKKQLTNELRNIDAAIADSYQAMQYVAATPLCSSDSFGKYGCVVTGDGTYDLRECMSNNGMYNWERDDGLLDVFGGAFGYRLNRAEKYATYERCRDDCFVYFYNDGLCAHQNNSQVPVEYGTDNALGALAGAADRQGLQYDKDGVNAILQCYSRTNYRLADILQTVEYCPGMTVDMAGRVGQAFATDPNVRVLKDVESIWGHGITSNLLCGLSWNAAQELENPPVAISTINVRDKINAYSMVLQNCQGLSDSDSQNMVATASEKLRTLPESGFFTGVWNVVETFGEPTNLKIIGATAVVSIVVPPAAVGIFGTSATTATTVVKGFHFATSTYFAVPMAIGLPASVKACANAGIDSQRCGEAVTQAAMIYGLTKAATKSAGEMRIADVNFADLRVKLQERIASLEGQKAVMEERFRLQGCAVGCDYNQFKFVEEQLEKLRKSENLLSDDRVFIETMLQLIESNRAFIEANEGLRVELIRKMKEQFSGSPDIRVQAFIKKLNSALATAEKDPLSGTVLEKAERGVPDETTGVRVKPSTEVKPYSIRLPTDEAMQNAGAGDIFRAISNRDTLKNIFSDAQYKDTVLHVLSRTNPEIALSGLPASPILLQTKFLGQGGFRTTFLIEFEYAGRTEGFVAKVGKTSLKEIETQKLLASKGLMTEVLSDEPIVLDEITSVTFEREIKGMTAYDAWQYINMDADMLSRIRTKIPDLDVFRDRPADLNQLSYDELHDLTLAIRSELMQSVGESVGRWWEQLVTVRNGVEAAPVIPDGRTPNMMVFSENGRMKTIYVDPLHPLVPDITMDTAVYAGTEYVVRTEFAKFVEQQTGYTASDILPTISDKIPGAGLSLRYEGSMHDFLDGMTRDNKLGGAAQTAYKITKLRAYMVERAKHFREMDLDMHKANAYDQYVSEIDNFLREAGYVPLEEPA